MDRVRRELVSSDDRNLGTTRYLYPCVVVNGSVISTSREIVRTHPDKTGTGMLRTKRDAQNKTDPINLRRR